MKLVARPREALDLRDGQAVPAVTPLRVVILDFDGVVLESNGLKTEVFREVFARYPPHLEAMMEYHLRHQSASRYAKFEHLVHERLGRMGDQELIDSLAAEFSDRIQARMATCPWVPGAQALLERVAPVVPVYLASVTPQEEIDRTVVQRGLSRYFARVYGCPPWDKVRAIQDIIGARGGVSDGVLLVGDSAGDQRAAAAAGIEFVARDSGLPFDEPQPMRYQAMTQIGDLLAPRLVHAHDEGFRLKP